MKNQWRVFIGLFLVLIVVIFAVMNNQQVPVNFGFAKITGPLIMIILGSAIIGAIVGLIASTSTMWQQKKEIKKLEKETEMYKNESSKLASEEADKVKREYENQLAELQAKYDAVSQNIPTESEEPEISESRVDRFTKPRNNE
ncbi:LapA family protein [Enterococcus sp. LJL99]